MARMTSTIQFPAYVIGLMSGTSADGVDAAILYTDGRDIVRAHESLFVAYDDALRGDILALMRGVGDEADVARRLTDVHIAAVKALLKKTKLTTGSVTLIGFHGQTIRHAPADGITVQIGDAARMARELGIAVVADFRSADVKAGGQGAPLVPLYHAALAHALEKPLMVVNIGGVSNVTWLNEGGLAPYATLTPAASGSREALRTPEHASIIAFDSGPGNALLDDWIFKHTGKRYDKDGDIAAMGEVHSDVLGSFLRHPFFVKDVPKSLDRNQFDGVVTKLAHLGLEDGAATLTSMTASSIAMALSAVPVLPKRVLICGGGRRNPTLMRLLSACVNAPVEAVEAVGWDGDMLEAQAFAYLAARSVQGLPLSLPSTTGVKEAVTGGVLYRA
jgi:anhydro-N-acetylmuramic acid kinase